jgi:hypothetical protein
MATTYNDPLFSDNPADLLFGKGDNADNTSNTEGVDSTIVREDKEEDPVLANFGDIEAKAKKFGEVFDKFTPEVPEGESFDEEDASRLARLSNAFRQTTPNQIQFRDNSGIAGNPFSTKIGTGIQQVAQGAFNAVRGGLQSDLSEEIGEAQEKKRSSLATEEKKTKREAMRQNFIQNAINQDLRFEYNQRIERIKEESRQKRERMKQEAKMAQMEKQHELKLGYLEAKRKLDEINDQNYSANQYASLFMNFNTPIKESMKMTRRSIEDTKERLAEARRFQDMEAVENYENSLEEMQSELGEQVQSYNRNVAKALNLMVDHGAPDWMTSNPTKSQVERIEGLVNNNASIIDVMDYLMTSGVDPNWLKENYKGYWQKNNPSQQAGASAGQNTGNGNEPAPFDGF